MKHRNPQQSTEIQAYLFAQDRWSHEQVRAWIGEHGAEVFELTDGDEYIHASVHPDYLYGPDTFRTITLSEDKGIKARVGKRRNPSEVSHRVPPKTVLLGQTLELVIAADGGDGHYNAEFGRWWALLAPVDAFERKDGYGRLYLAPLEVVERASVDPDSETKSADAYRDWHDGRDPRQELVLEVPDALNQQLGRATRIDYRSDKFGDRGEFVEYTHNFGEPGPLVYYSSSPEGFALVGGGFRVDRRGIVG